MRKRQSLRKFIAGVLVVVMVFGTAFAGAPISAKAAGETVKIVRDEIQKISAKSFHGSTPLDNIYDGNLGNYVDTDYNDTSTEQPMWFQFELKETAKVNQVKIHPRSDGPNGRPDSYKIYAGGTEDALSVVASGTIDSNVVDWTTVSFNAVDAKVVRVELTSATFPEVHVVTVAEVELYKEVVEEQKKTPEEDLRDQIRTKMAEVEKLYVKGEYTFSVDEQYNSRMDDVQKRLDDPNADVDKLTWGITYMDQLLKALNNPVNKLSAIDKQVYDKNVEREGIDPSIYTAEQVETPKHEHEDVAFENAITEPVTELKEGTYYLDADITQPKAVQVSGDVKLCLNNHSIAVGTIKVPEGVSLTICDCGENGAITSKLAKVMEITGGTVTLESGTIRSTSTSTVDGAMYIKSGTININGGRVETTAKHAIYGYATSATVNVTGGEIVNGGMADDSEFKNRGSIVAYNSTTVNISGGTVAGVWSGSGSSRVNISGGTIKGSVYTSAGQTTISGDAVITNTKDWAIAARGGTTTITGGTITGKTDGVCMCKGDLVISGGTIHGDVNGLNAYDTRYPTYSCNANVKISGGNITGGKYGADLTNFTPTKDYYMFSVSGTPTIKGETADILVSKEKQVYGQIDGVAYAGEPLTIAGNNEDFKEDTVIVVVKAPVDPADVLDKFEYQSEEFELVEGEGSLVLKEVPKATITFSVDGKTTTAVVREGEALGANLPEAPTKEGYTFKGWNTKEDGTGEAVTVDTKANEDMTVYAVFEKIVVPVEKVTVTFDVDGQKTDVEIVKGEAIGANLPEDPSKEGYTFKGWNTKEDGTGEAVTVKTKADKNMVVYAIFEKNTAEVVPPFMSSVTVENGKVTIVLKDKPTKAPTIEDVKLQMNLNGAGNKDVKITGFKYDGDKTITLTFEKIASTDKKQTFTMTVTFGDQSVTTREITVPVKTTSEDERVEDNKNNVKTGDNTPITTLVVTMLLAAGIVVATLFYRRKMLNKL